MAGPRSRCNLPFDGKNELARAPTEGNSTAAVFHAPISASGQALFPTPAPAPASVPGPPGRYMDKDI